MIKCPVCQATFRSWRSLAIHLTKKEKFSQLQREETILFLRFGEDKINELVDLYKNQKESCYTLLLQGFRVDNYFKLLGIKRTSSEERATERYREKYKSSIFNKYGVENISQSSEIKEQKKKTVFENYGVTHNFLIKEVKEKCINNYQIYSQDKVRVKNTLDKSIKTYLQRYGVTNPSQNLLIKQKILASNTERIKNLSVEDKREMTAKAREVWANSNDWVSKPEIKIHRVLENLGFILNQDFFTHVFWYGYNYDIFIKPNIIIEVQGDFWHANPQKYNSGDIILKTLVVDTIWEKDKRKKAAAVDAGRKFYELWEGEIMKSSEADLALLISKIIGEKNE